MLGGGLGGTLIASTPPAYASENDMFITPAVISAYIVDVDELYQRKSRGIAVAIAMLRLHICGCLYYKHDVEVMRDRIYSYTQKPRKALGSKGTLGNGDALTCFGGERPQRANANGGKGIAKTWSSYELQLYPINGAIDPECQLRLMSIRRNRPLWTTFPAKSATRT